MTISLGSAHREITGGNRSVRGVISVLALSGALASPFANALIVTQWEVAVESSFDPASILDSDGATPGAVNLSNDNRTLSWGTGKSGPSSLQINDTPITTVVSTAIAPDVLPPVANVSFTHNNQTIVGDTLEQVSFLNEITLTPLSQAGSSQPPTVLNFLIDFVETTNNVDEICANGTPIGQGINSEGCGDIFVIGDDALNYSFFYDAGDGFNQEYFISFVEVTNGLQSLSSEACLSATGSADPCLGFVTPERASTSFQFGALITSAPLVIGPPGPGPNPVPAPGALSLFGLGLILMCLARRRPR
ncbi:MAG: THxN family PEP-CTERM protein [Pseudomonadota bacterium]